MHSNQKKFKYQTEQFADIRILRRQVPGFESLPLKQKKLCFCLYQAILCGRDITYDQNCKHNLKVRKSLEQIIKHFAGSRATKDFKNFLTYAKRVLVSNGIHHHYSTDKIIPSFSKKYFAQLVKKSPGAEFPLSPKQNSQSFVKELTEILFNPRVAPKRVCLDPKKDMITSSATNFYEGVTQKEVERYYLELSKHEKKEFVSHGLNTKVVKQNGMVKELAWKVGDMYSPAIEHIVLWLEQALPFTENAIQKKSLKTLIDFYKTGCLKKFDEHCICWIKNNTSHIDLINGFIEVYGDPLGKKGTYEGLVSLKDVEGTKRANLLSKNAQWFENHSPIDAEFKKKNVKGVTARAIHSVVGAGDCSPTSPRGINLPNSDWIRQTHGSKSSTISNIISACEEAAKTDGSLKEFSFSQEKIALSQKYGVLSDVIFVDLHEVIGHGSGQLRKGIKDPSHTLKNYFSTLEEARADLVALYYLMDPKLISLGVMPNLDVGKLAYDAEISGGLMKQLVRVEKGKNIEESHMRDRQMIAQWACQRGKADNVIEKKKKNGKTYFVINDYQKLRKIFGELLKKVQHIKSTGDFRTGKKLIETYGVKVDQKLHAEVLKRWKRLNIAPYVAFINPKLTPVIKKNKVVDIKITYPEDFLKQMMEYGKDYAFL